MNEADAKKGEGDDRRSRPSPADTEDHDSSVGAVPPPAPFADHADAVPPMPEIADDRAAEAVSV